MSLFYPPSEKQDRGKTSEREDRFFARFVELELYEKIVEAISFDSNDPDFWGEMIMEITFQTIDNGTKVTFVFKNIPNGIRPEDNEAGTISSLGKLARYVEYKLPGTWLFPFNLSVIHLGIYRLIGRFGLFSFLGQSSLPLRHWESSSWSVI